MALMSSRPKLKSDEFASQLVKPQSRAVKHSMFQILLFAACMFLNNDLYHLEHDLIIPIDSGIYIQTSLCSRFANYSKLLEPNNLPLWQFVTKLTYKMKCPNTRTTEYNKMPKYITNPNLKLLTQKLQEEIEGLDQNVPVFPKNTQKNTSLHVRKERHINNN